MIIPGFKVFTLPLDTKIFNKLINSVDFQKTGKGRLGNLLVKTGEQGVPIVRATTQYNIPAYSFSAIHNTVLERINTLVNDESLNFNNALIEVYAQTYSSMNFHSDQALDLATGSYIALFSCYEYPECLSENHIRKLIVKEKGADEEFEIPLTNNSVVLFSLEANSRFVHKIVLNSKTGQKQPEADNRWLGITFRRSKTFIRFENSLPYFPDGQLLELANEEQQKEFFRLRGEENRNVDFVYPSLSYTLSPADRLPPL